MRILFIHNYYQQRGGEDVIFEQEVDALRQAGLPVETVTFTNEGFDGSLLGNLSGAIRSLRHSGSARRVGEALDRFKPDVVHIHNLFYTASPGVIDEIKKRGIPVVMTLHNYRLVCVGGTLMRPGEVPCERCLTQTLPLDGIRFGCFRDSKAQSAQLTAITGLHKLLGTWQRIDRFISLTEFGRKKILQSSLKLKPEQVVVKPNFVPDLGYSGPENRDDFFLYVGRLSPEKGIQTLIDAAWLGTHPIRIVGDGPLRPLVEQAAAELPHLQYVGKLTRDEAAEQLKRCRAFVITSICYEGLPTTMLEAFATGTPIVTSDVENLLTIIRHGKLGTAFKAGNAQSLHEVLTHTRQQPLTTSLTESLYREFRERYAADRVLNEVLSIYESVVNENTFAQRPA